MKQIVERERDQRSSVTAVLSSEPSHTFLSLSEKPKAGNIDFNYLGLRFKHTHAHTEMLRQVCVSESLEPENKLISIYMS